MSQKWEMVDDSSDFVHTERLEVPGGYLYRVIVFRHAEGESTETDFQPVSVSVAFVPDRRVSRFVD